MGEVWSFVLQGGAMAVLAVLVIVVGPKLLSDRVAAIEKLSDKWLESRGKDREKMTELITVLVRIAVALESGKKHDRERADRGGT